MESPDTTAWFEGVVRENYERLLRVGYYETWSAAKAEEAAQAGVVKAWKNIHTLKDRKKVVPWLHRIVRNMARDLGRKGGKTETIQVGDDLHLLESEPPESCPVEADLREILWREVGRLPSALADVLYLRYQQGCGNAEIAAALHLSPEAVRVRFFRAYARLRENPLIRHAIGDLP